MAWEPWFDKNAVCQILGLNYASKVMERLSVKGVNPIQVLTKGGMQKKTFIDEKNLYRLIGRSEKPQAIRFMDWVYDEVLPSIRKTGHPWSPAPELSGYPDLGSLKSISSKTEI